MELFMEADGGLDREAMEKAIAQSLEGRTLRKVLLIPPDFTRYHSNGGWITQVYWRLLKARGCQVDLLPALGTHEPLTKEQFSAMYGDIPYEDVSWHDWRNDVVTLGEVPADRMKEFTDGAWQERILVQVNRLVMDPSYDLILSIGQVVPHEVIGMSNHSKNIFVGVGGSDMIHKSHMAGAVYGLERMMGRDHTPVRRAFDYALGHYLSDRPIVFVLTVTTAPKGEICTHGLFISEGRTGLERAIALARKKNMDVVERGIRKCVVWLDPSEYHSTWLGNKAVYRTRMAMEEGGELIVLAPGVRKFGEDADCDRLIRKYGYCGREQILKLFRENEDLQQNMGVAAHLIHGSSDDRFRVTYAVREISEGEIRSVHLQPAVYEELVRRYDPEKLSYGWNRMPDGEEIFFIPNPALGLWIEKERFVSAGDAQS